MKRYLLFWFAQFYPSGGWNDLIGSFDSIAESHAEIIKRNKPGDLWFGDFQLIDGQTGEELSTYEATKLYWENSK
jgi:hypothetical protein